MPIPVPEGTPLDPSRPYAQGPDGIVDTSDLTPNERSVSQYTPLRPEDIEAANLQQKYGGAGQTAIGVGEGLLSGFTAGGSRNAEVHLGLTTPEAIRGREEASPYATGLANAAGFGAGLWGADEIAGLLKGADGVGSLAAQAGAAARASGGVADGASGALTSKMLTGAVTQAAYGAGQELPEEGLGSIPFNAEAVIQAAGFGAAIGATGEGLFGLAGRALPAASGKLSSTLGALGNMAADGFKSLSSTLTGQAKPVIERLFEDKAEAVAQGGFEDLYKNAFDDSAKGAGSTLAEAVEHGDDLHKAARATLLNDFENTLEKQDPIGLLNSAREELAQYSSRLDEARADPDTYSRLDMIESYQGKINSAMTKLDTIADKVQGKLLDPIAPPVWGSEAFDTFKAMDDFRTSAQNGVDYTKLQAAQIPKEHLATVQLARDIAHDAAEFTKDPEVWGDVGARWRDWQSASSRWQDTKKNLMDAMGAKEFGRKELNPLKMRGMLNKVYQDGDAYSGRLLDEVGASAKQLNDATQKVYAKVPSSSYDAVRMDSLLDNVSKLRDKALDAKGMSDVVRELGGGGGMGVGAVGFGAYLAGKLGLTLGQVGPAAAIYAGARAASRPVGTIEAFARVASAVAKLNKAIPKGAKDAFDGLLRGTEYGAMAGLYDLVKEHVLANQLTARNKDRADNWNDATHKVTSQIGSLIANPEQTASQVGNAWGPLPPKTRALGVAKVQNILNFNALNRPKMQPSPSVLKPGEPRMTPTDALKAARLYHLTTAPVQALGEHLVNRDLTAADVAAATAAFPETTAKWQASLIEHAIKEKDLPLDVQSQLAIATGRPAWPLGYSFAQQSGFGSTGPASTPSKGGNVPAKDTESRKFKSEQANAERLPSSKPIT